MSMLVLHCPTRNVSREFNILESGLTLTLVNGKKKKETCTFEGTELLPRRLALDGDNYNKVVKWLKKLGKG